MTAFFGQFGFERPAGFCQLAFAGFCETTLSDSERFQSVLARMLSPRAGSPRTPRGFAAAPWSPRNTYLGKDGSTLIGSKREVRAACMHKPHNESKLCGTTAPSHPSSLHDSQVPQQLMSYRSRLAKFHSQAREQLQAQAALDAREEAWKAHTSSVNMRFKADTMRREQHSKIRERECHSESLSPPHVARVAHHAAHARNE